VCCVVAGKARAEGGRTKASTGADIKESGIKIGGDFTPTTTPEYIPHRIALFEKLKAAADAETAGMCRYLLAR
jgi:hypothetical protein